MHTRELRYRLPATADKLAYVHSICVCGERLVLVGHQGVASVWSLCTGKRLCEQGLTQTGLACSLDRSEWVAFPTGESPTMLAICHLENDHSLKVSFELPQGHAGAVNALCGFRDGHGWALASGGVDRCILLHRFALSPGDKGRPDWAFLSGHTGAVRALCHIPAPMASSESWLASSSVDTTVTEARHPTTNL